MPTLLKNKRVNIAFKTNKTMEGKLLNVKDKIPKK